ncbi:MAG: eIF2A-related protein [Saprospiraceae bacterium]
MKYELSHDILAKKVYEKSSQEDKMLRKIETFIRERHDYFLAQGVMLVKEDLAYVSPYLKQVNISNEQRKFIAKSAKKVKRNEGKQLIRTLSLVVLPVLLGLSIWALYKTREATAERKKAEIAKEEAEKAQAIAENASETIKVERIKAEVARDSAVYQKHIAEKKATQLKIAEGRLRSKIEDVRKAKAKADFARKAAQEAAKRAAEAKVEAEKQAELAAAQAKIAETEKRYAEEARAIAEEQQKIALEAEKKAIKIAEEAKQLAIIAQQKEKEARALYLASLAENALKLKKGIIAYNLARMSWKMDENLVAQKILFDCQNAYLTDNSIFQEYEEKGFQRYSEQVSTTFNQQMQSKTIESFGSSVRKNLKVASLNYVVFSNNKRFLALLLSKTVNIRDVNSGVQIATIKLKSKAKNIVFANDDESFLVITEKGIAKLYTNQGKLIKELTIDSNAKILKGAFSPKGKNYLATVTDDKKGQLWDEKGQLIKAFDVFVAEGDVIPYNDGQHIFRLSGDGTPQKVNIFSNKIITFKTARKNKNDICVKLQVSPDGQYLMTQSLENSIQLWKINGKFLGNVAPSNLPDDAIFSPSGKEIITTSTQMRRAILWDLSGKKLAEFNYDGSDAILSIEFSDDKMRVLVARTKIANLWGRKGRLLYSFEPKTKILNASFSEDNKSIIVITQDGSVDTWNIIRPKEIIDYYDFKVNIRALNKAERDEYEIEASDFLN